MKNILKIPIEPHFAGNYRIQYDGKYVSLYGLDNRYDMAGIFGAPDGTFDEMVLIPVIEEVRNASPIIRRVTSTFIEIILFNRRIDIKNAEDYGDWATDVLSEMTESIINDLRYCRPITDNDIEEGADPDWSFVFTENGSRMVNKWRDRLVRLGEHIFPNEEIDVQNWHYDES